MNFFTEIQTAASGVGHWVSDQVGAGATIVGEAVKSILPAAEAEGTKLVAQELPVLVNEAVAEFKLNEQNIATEETAALVAALIAAFPTIPATVESVVAAGFVKFQDRVLESVSARIQAKVAS